MDLHHFLGVFAAQKFTLYCAWNYSILKSIALNEFATFSNKFFCGIMSLVVSIVVCERSWCMQCSQLKGESKTSNNIALATETTARSNVFNPH